MSSGTNIARESSRGGFGMGCSMRPPSSAISAHSSIRGTPRDIRDWLMSLPGASPVSHFPWPGGGGERMTHETCGRRRLNAFAWYDREWRCWRTCQGSLLQDMNDEFSATWPKAGLMHNGVCYRRPRWERPISENASGLWATPRAGKVTSENLNSWEKRHAEGKVSTPPLALAVQMYPIPRASDNKSGRVSEETLGKNSRPLNEVVANYPTPNASDATGGPGSSGRDGGPNLRTVANGQLNPDWVEWLMGWPLGWTSMEPLPRESWDAWIEGMLSGEWWLEEPEGIPRVGTGISNRVARIKALGNGQVPLCAATAWDLLWR